MLTAAFKRVFRKKLTQEQKPSIRKLLSTSRKRRQAQNAQRVQSKNTKTGGLSDEAGNQKAADTPTSPICSLSISLTKSGRRYGSAAAQTLSAKLLQFGTGFSAAFSSSLPEFASRLILLIGIAGAVIIRLIVYIKGKNAKKYRKAWNTALHVGAHAEDIKPYIDPVFENNVLLTQTETAD